MQPVGVAPTAMEFGPLGRLGSRTFVVESATLTVPAAEFVMNTFSCAHADETADAASRTASPSVFISSLYPGLRRSRRRRQNSGALGPLPQRPLVHELEEGHVPRIRVPGLPVEPALVEFVLVPAPEIHEVVAVGDQPEIPQLVAVIVRDILPEEISADERCVVVPRARRGPQRDAAAPLGRRRP